MIKFLLSELAINVLEQKKNEEFLVTCIAQVRLLAENLNFFFILNFDQLCKKYKKKNFN